MSYLLLFDKRVIGEYDSLIELFNSLNPKIIDMPLFDGENPFDECKMILYDTPDIAAGIKIGDGFPCCFKSNDTFKHYAECHLIDRLTERGFSIVKKSRERK